MKIKSRISSYHILILLFLIETILVAWIYHGITPLLKSALILISSLSIGVLPLFLKEANQIVPLDSRIKKVLITLSIIGIIIFILSFHNNLKTFKIHLANSDIIPWLKVYTSRFLAGEKVYAPYNFGPYTEHPSWLPTVWMPFNISTILDIDHRMLALILFIISFSFFGLKFRKSVDFKGSWTTLFTGLFVLFSFLIGQRPVFGNSIELIIVAYYLFFFVAIFSENPYLIGISLGLCLLSRYSVSFWIFVPFLVYVVQRRFKELIKIAAIIAGMVLCLFVIPFLWHDFQLLQRLQAVYQQTTLGEWRHFIPTYNRPISIFTGNGLACWFYELVGGDVSKRLQTLQLAQIIFCILTVFIISVYFLLKRKQIQSTKLFLLTSLKIYFAFFYGFIQIPYTYLWLVPIFLSMLIVSAVLSSPKTIFKSLD